MPSTSSALGTEGRRLSRGWRVAQAVPIFPESRLPIFCRQFQSDSRRPLFQQRVLCLRGGNFTSNWKSILTVIVNGVDAARGLAPEFRSSVNLETFEQRLREGKTLQHKVENIVLSSFSFGRTLLGNAAPGSGRIARNPERGLGLRRFWWACAVQQFYGQDACVRSGSEQQPFWLPRSKATVAPVCTC